VIRGAAAAGGPWRGLPAAVIRALVRPTPGVPAAEPPGPDRVADLVADRAAASGRIRATAARLASAARPAVLAVVADDAERAALRAAGPVLVIRPEDWVATMEAASPDLLLVTSTRAGNGGAWTHRIAWAAHPDRLLGRDLDALLRWCADHDIATVFAVTPGGAAALDDWRDAADRFDLVLAPSAGTADALAASTARRGAVVVEGAVDRESVLGAVARVAA
jgi:hypothetical protein